MPPAMKMLWAAALVQWKRNDGLRCVERIADPKSVMDIGGSAPARRYSEHCDLVGCRYFRPGGERIAAHQTANRDLNMCARPKGWQRRAISVSKGDANRFGRHIVFGQDCQIHRFIFTD